MFANYDLTIQFLENLLIDHKFPTRKDDQFNFFSAIVSGKANRAHIEFYHSNVIANLLKLGETNRQRKIFLLELIKLIDGMPTPKNFQNIDLNKIRENYIVEREKTVNGNLDIYLQSIDNNWAFFIENKINSREGKNQLLDYCNWFEKKFDSPQWFGIYLTKYGNSPESFYEERNNASKEFQSRIILLSYTQIVTWLESCLNDQSIQDDHELSYFVKQYIITIKQLIAMPESDNELKNKFIDNPELTSEFVEHFKSIKATLDEIVLSKRGAFKIKLIEALKGKLEKTNWHSINEKLEKNHHIISGEFENQYYKIRIGQSFPAEDDGGRGLWWGLYPNDDKAKYSYLDLDNGFWESIKIPTEGMGINATPDYLNDFAEHTDIFSAHLIRHNEIFDSEPNTLINEIIENLISKISIQIELIKKQEMKK